MSGIVHITILLMLLFSACSCENIYDDNTEYDEAIALVERITIDSVSNKTATLTLFCFSPNPCWEFSRVQEVRDSNQIYATVYRKVKRYQTCIAVVSAFSHQYNISVETHGNYTVKIYRSPTTTLDTTITF